MRTSVISRTMSYLVLVVGMCFVLAPLYLTLTIAMKTTAETAKSFFALPSSFYMGNFVEVIHKANFFKFVGNSVYVTILSILLMLLLIPMVSYAISRNFSKPYYKFLYLFVMSGIFVPFQAIMLPIYRHMSNLKLLDQNGLIVMYVTLAFAQGIFLCVGFLKNIPLELDEASKIDGSGVWTTFTRIIYPLMLPIIATVLILNSLWIWNDFQLPLIILNRHPDYWTLPLFIYNFKSEYAFNYNLAFAGFFISMLPIIILYGFTQKYIIGGLTEGALK
ncbi:carbohydrate ABC transporter permease [Paenibacillus radicis (ex Xue et al. 2023)]|uniref:Carbohydrate ABC transporter permease n=1 Tax=Paenibacillus radicis (ex Xue et al. 2023) TaxID=2972489 RepID=A0ABT1YH13_9BACL|nr:carbohydrate ABC transporter permease [Paenibacillus radicis (ex Xue et al. 2023)]MCR8632247.1 carbohydrate ABC transporter permease [Paenibacillus radicis (ex Xue et al. 2023)]